MPAGEAELLECFELASGASIVIEDDAPLSISRSALSLAKEDRRTLELTWKGSKLNPRKAEWKTENKKIVNVNHDGDVAAKSKGVVRITATYQGHTASCIVKATNASPWKRSSSAFQKRRWRCIPPVR